jgi:hypothetical protein
MTNTNSQSIPSQTITPAPEVGQLAWFLGDWVIQSRIKTENGWAEDTCYSRVELMLDGHALLEKFWGHLDGEAINGMSMRVYNPALNRWEQAWLDSTGRRIGVYYGEYKDGQFIGRNQKSLEDPANAKSHQRETFFDIQSERFSWKLETSKDLTEWNVVWELSYTRQSQNE